MPRPFVLVALLAAGCGSPAPVAVPEAGSLTKLAPGTHEQTADVPEVGEVRYAIDIPATFDGTTPVPLVLALHYAYDGPKPPPYTGKALLEAFRPGLADLNGIVIAPDAVGGKWTAPANETAAVWLVQSAMKTYPIDPKRVVITGFSMGGEGTWFIGSRHQDLFTGAIPVAAPVAGGDEWTIPVYVIHSDRDEIVSYSAAKKHAEAVRAKGGRVEFKTAAGLTHYRTAAYAPFVADGVRWLRSE